jgi:hypothetical protein
MPALQNTDWIVSSPLVVGTYHFGLGGEASIVQSASFFWDAATIGNITIWTSDYPSIRVTLVDVVAGHWIQQQPTQRYVAISPAGACTENNLTMTIPGAIAGGCNIDVGNFGQRHLKAIVVITTQGLFGYSWNGKD